MLIGIDVGTTAVKAALFDRHGNALKSFSQRYKTDRLSGGRVEQDPEDWMRLVLAALAQFESGLPTGTVQAIGLCSQVNTHVFANAGGKALLPAFTWQDGRCASDGERLDAQVSVAQKLNWWGAPLPIDASHVLSRMAYVEDQHPDIWRDTRWVLAPKDYCLRHLTGEVVTDPMTAFGIVDGNLNIIGELVSLVKGASRRLPPISAFTKVVGRIRHGLPFSGIPVVAGAMDAWSGLLGAGVSEEEQGVYLSGTSEILGIVSSRKFPVPGVIAFPSCEGITLHAGPTQSGGASVEWLSKLLGRTPVEISALAASVDTSRPLPMFLPHLEGERAPLWDINSRGSLSALSSGMGPAEVARATLEGVGYSARLVVESLEASSGVRPAAFNHSGGGAASDIWCQIRADILGRAIKRMKVLDAGVLGAAVMAGTGIGVFASLAEAARNFVAVDRVFEPDSDEQRRHQRGFEKYKQLYQQLVPWNGT